MASDPGRRGALKLCRKGVFGITVSAKKTNNQRTPK
jgi:hypothetical protein